MKEVPLLLSLDLRRCGIGTIGAKVLAEGLTYVPLLQALEVSMNNIGHVGGKALVAVLKHVPLLSTLDLHRPLICIDP